MEAAWSRKLNGRKYWIPKSLNWCDIEIGMPSIDGESGSFYVIGERLSAEKLIDLLEHQLLRVQVIEPASKQ